MRDLLSQIAIHEAAPSGGGGSLANPSGLNARFVDGWIVFRILREGTKFKLSPSPRLENEIRI
jgi:hypothetical protein